jgi:hypothetical protein
MASGLESFLMLMKSNSCFPESLNLSNVDDKILRGEVLAVLHDLHLPEYLVELSSACFFELVGPSEEHDLVAELLDEEV